MGRVKIEDPSEDVELLVHNSQSVGYGGVAVDLSQRDGGPTVMTIFFSVLHCCVAHIWHRFVQVSPPRRRSSTNSLTVSRVDPCQGYSNEQGEDEQQPMGFNEWFALLWIPGEHVRAFRPQSVVLATDTSTLRNTKQGWS